MKYACRLEEANGSGLSMSALIVVGRQDTGDLEAQIRGSKHAWSVRLISVEALAKILFLSNELEDESFGYKVNKILRPFEYTKVDDIVNLVFETQRETEKTITGEDNNSNGGGGGRSITLTPAKDLDAKRITIAGKFFAKSKIGFQRKTKTNFESDDGKIGICCAISKRYENSYQPYWYALHPKWIDFMEDHNEGYFVLGCMDRSEAFCIPISIIIENLENLNSTKTENKHYWHIKLIEEDGSIKLYMSKNGIKIDLSKYSIGL